MPVLPTIWSRGAKRSRSGTKQSGALLVRGTLPAGDEEHDSSRPEVGRTEIGECVQLARRSLCNHMQGEQEHGEHRVLRVSAGTRQHDRGTDRGPSGHRLHSGPDQRRGLDRRRRQRLSARSNRRWAGPDRGEADVPDAGDQGRRPHLRPWPVPTAPCRLFVTLNVNKNTEPVRALGKMLLQNLQLVVGKRYESEAERRRLNKPIFSVVLDEFAPFGYRNFAQILQTARGTNTAFLFSMQSLPQLFQVGKGFK